MKTNCYIISDEATNEGLVIDPGFDPEKVISEIGNLSIKAIVLTHGHYDHVTSAFELKEKVNAPVMINKDDEAMMSYSTQKRADRLLNDKDKLDIGNLSFVIIHTPGHSQGSFCLYNEKEKALFSGDTLFAGDYGRTDLPGSSPPDMENSLKKLLRLPPETEVYPGHGRTTTIEAEKNLLE